MHVVLSAAFNDIPASEVQHKVVGMLQPLLYVGQGWGVITACG